MAEEVEFSLIKCLSPLYEQEMLSGLQSVAPAASCLTNAGDVQSMLYILLLRMLHEVRLMGMKIHPAHLLISSFPEKLISTFPFWKWC